MDQNIDNKMPRVSINIATYNRGNFIREAIESVLAQTFIDWELIIVDDASTDNTKEIIAPYLADPRIKYFRNEKNLNISLTRNRGLQESRGEFVAILDSDDLWCDKEKLSKQVAFLDANPDYGLVGTGVIKIDPTGKEIDKYQNPLSDGEVRRQILSRNTFAHSSVLYRRQIALDLGLYDPALNAIEDYDLWLKIGQKWHFANLPALSLKYRVHSSNISLLDRQRLMKINLDLVKKNRAFYPNFYPAMARRLVRFRFYRLLHLFA